MKRITSKAKASGLKLNNVKQPSRGFNIDIRTVGICMLSTQLISNAIQVTPTEIFKNNSTSVHTIESIEYYSDPFSPERRLERVLGTGTGFSYITEQYIVTNAHVIEESFQVKVDGQDAEIIGLDQRHDIALLKVPQGSKPLSKCTKPVDIGTSVLAIGNPYGFSKSLTSGIISGTDRKLDSRTRVPLMGLLQTDAPINPGNSGGPLLEARSGCVLGVNTALVSSSGNNSGVGFAIPIQTVDGIVYDMINKKDHDFVILGVTLLPDVLSEGLGMKGVLIENVLPGSIASDLGLVGTHRDGTGRPIIGDVILELNGKQIRKVIDIYDTLETLKKGDEITIKILKHDGEHEYNIRF